MKEQKKSTEKVYAPQRLTFVTLRPGESVKGIFMGRSEGRFGPVYRFRTSDGPVAISGNRYQLDAVMEEIMLDTESFPNGPVGHMIRITRGKDVKLEGNRTVATYEGAHVIDECPMGCAPF